MERMTCHGPQGAEAMRRSRPLCPAGFSLIELLVVIAIVSLLTFVGVVGFGSIASGWRVKEGGNMIMDQLSLAQQTAISKNSRVRWQIVSVPDQRSGDPEAFRLTRLQVFVPAQRSWQDIGPGKLLPRSVFASTNGSTLLAADRVSATQLPGGVDAPAGSIVFFGNGMPDLNPNGMFSLTLQAGGNTNNLLVLQMDPVSGRMRAFQQ